MLLSQRPPWFCRQALTFAIDEDSYARREYWFFNLSLGRESNFNKNIGISYDAGIGIILSENKEIKGESFFDLDFDFYVYPVVRIQLYFSLNKRRHTSVNMAEYLPGLKCGPVSGMQN